MTGQQPRVSSSEASVREIYSLLDRLEDALRNVPSSPHKSCAIDLVLKLRAACGPALSQGKAEAQADDSGQDAEGALREG